MDVKRGKARNKPGDFFMRMDRLSLKNKQDFLFPGETLPQICMNLKMWCDGSFESMQYYKRKVEHINFLNDILENWDFESFTLFDKIVHEMVECTRNMLEGK